MKNRILVFMVCGVVATAMFLLVWQSSQAKRHEEYLYLWGTEVTTYLGDNEEYPKSLKDYVVWRASTTGGGDPNEVIESWLRLCVCPLTDHKPQTLDSADDWADIKIVPYLSVLMPGEIMLAYCPAENHKDHRIRVVLWRPVKNSRSSREHYHVESMSKEVFDKKLEQQRTAFETVTRP